MEPKMKEPAVRGQIGFLGILPEGAAEWRDVRRANSAPKGLEDEATLGRFWSFCSKGRDKFNSGVHTYSQEQSNGN